MLKKQNNLGVVRYMKNWINGAKDKKFIASYSGGKDSTLALYKAMKQGAALGIIAMMEEDGERSRAHSLFYERKLK